MSAPDVDTSSPYLLRDARLSAMARALRGLPERQLADRAARVDCYALAGIASMRGLEERDDADALSLARTHRALFPGDRAAVPVLIDARIAFVRRAVISPRVFAEFAAQPALYAEAAGAVS